MLAILEFIFASWGHFIGTLILILVITVPLSGLSLINVHIDGE